MLLSPELPFHPGEERMHQLMKAPKRESPTSPFLTPGGGFMLQRAPLLAVGTLDEQGRPWSTVWGSGDVPLAQVLGENVVGVRARVDPRFDPVVEALMKGRDGDGVVKLEDNDDAKLEDPGDVPVHDHEKVRKLGGLTIELEQRRRVKIAGRMMMGVMKGNETEKDGPSSAEITLVAKIEESLGNCPKYLNKKHIVSAEPEPSLLSESIQLPQEAVSLVEKADLFFVTSSHEQRTMDTNHRGGPPGFVRIVSNEASGAVLVWPDYSGNRLYQTLGNFITTPLAGIVIPDFDTGDVLYVTGVPEVLTGQEAAALLPRSNLAVKVNITGARFVQKGLSFRGEPGDASPYNPAVRYASTEKGTPGTSLPQKSRNQAVLLSRTDLTPTIARFRFRIEDPSEAGPWKPGQYATLSFADELDIGYSHMRDDDPKSLNDDFIRTFTVSSPPSKKSMADGTPDGEFELTIRKVGSATQHLFRQNPRAGFELPLNGFEGEFAFDKKPQGGIIPIITAGIGITPVLGQLTHMDVSQVKLLWSVSLTDIGLAADTFKLYPELVKATTLFVTGKEENARDEQKDLLKQVTDTGVQIERRRIGKADIDEIDSKPGVDEWYMCVGPSLKTSVLAWLAGKRVVYEDFDY